MVELCGCHYEFKDALLTKIRFPSQSLLSPLAIWLLYKLTPVVFNRIVLSLFENHFSLILEYCVSPSSYNFFPQPLLLTPPLSIYKCLSARDHGFIFGSVLCSLLILPLSHLTHSHTMSNQLLPSDLPFSYLLQP